MKLKSLQMPKKVEVDDDALLAVARGAEGALRDAESALDQLISFKGEKIVEEDVLSVFGLVSREKLEALAEGVLKGDIKRLIGLVHELDDAGKDLQRLLIELIALARQLILEDLQLLALLTASDPPILLLPGQRLTRLLQLGP